MPINYMDNPWFPNVLRKEMERDKANNYELYRQKWLGEPVGKGGRVWQTYDDKVHVREFSMEFIAEKGNSFVAIDPHSKFYPAAIFYTVLPKNARGNWPEDFYIHVYDEFPNFDFFFSSIDFSMQSQLIKFTFDNKKNVFTITLRLEYLDSQHNDDQFQLV